MSERASGVRIVVDLVLLSGTLHFAWEILQAPLFSSLDGASHLAGVLECARATLGDVLIIGVAFLIARALAGPTWNSHALGLGALVFLGVGLIATIALEFINTELLDRWTYDAAMPRVPIVGTGLAPLAQWVIIPLVVLWYLRRLHPPLATRG